MTDHMGQPLHDGNDQAPEQIRLDRETLIRETIERMRCEKRRGYASAMDKLDDEMLVSVAMMHMGNAKIADIQATLEELLAGKPVPDEKSVSRWLTRFSFMYGLVRAGERHKLAVQVKRLDTHTDLQDTSILAAKMLIDAAVNTLADKPDLSDMSASEQTALISAISVCTKAGFDEKITAAKLRQAELKAQRLQQDIDTANFKIEGIRKAAEAARRELEAKARPGDGGAQQIDAQAVYAALDRVLRGEAA